MIAKNLLATVATTLLALVIQSSNAEYEVGPFCKRVPSGTKLASMESCQTYYTCGAAGSQPIAANCSSTQSFDKNTQTCRDSAFVNCYYGVDNPCQNKNNVFAPVAKNCQSWVYCVNGAEKGSGNCPTGEIFDATKGACVYGSCSTNDTSTGFDSVTNSCLIMPSDEYFGDLDDCSEWNICSKSNVLTTGNCDNNLVYNTQSRMCVDNVGNVCARTNGEAPYLPTISCNSTNNGNLLGDSNICSTYYKCNGTNWTKLQCTAGNYFNVPTGSCISRQAATPETGCNRCQYAATTWVNAVDSTCGSYLTCSNGLTIGKGKCPTGQFFDEQRQVCIENELPTYAGNNGACAASPDNPPTAAPTNAPTAAPTNAPTAAPTAAPTNAPTNAPTAAPTAAPTNAPTNAPANGN